MVIETLIAESMKAQAQAQTELPVVNAYANAQNAQAFKVFCEAAGIDYKGDQKAAIDGFKAFCKASSTGTA